jgi:hypothetical protein
LPGAGRGEEIAAWLADHDVGGYVIIDDHADMGELHGRLVQTHPAHGLQPGDVPRAIAILMTSGPRMTRDAAARRPPGARARSAPP